jgi:hypothetical protein
MALLSRPLIAPFGSFRASVFPALAASAQLAGLYGHRDKGRALDRIIGAYADAANGAARKNRPRQSGSSTAIPSQQSLFGDTYV